MDRNELLSATRAEFLQSFLVAADQAIADAIKALSRKADFSFSVPERRALLDAHRVLTNQQPVLRVQLQRTMEQLLTRSFQTTYNTFRPSFSTEANGLALIDAVQFEDQLRVDETTARFRNAADQQLRDLNIRIALLFEQNAIKERENPFRPWLFTRGIATGVEALGERPEVAALLIRQIGESIEESIPLIYNGINALLADYGIAAQLQLKVQRSHGAGTALAGGRAESSQAGDPDLASRLHHAAQPGVEVAGAAPAVTSATRGDHGQRELSSDIPTVRVDQLMEIVRRMAESNARPAGANVSRPGMLERHDRSTAAPCDRTSADSVGAEKSLGRSHRVGEVLRRFFAGQASPPSFQDDRGEPSMVPAPAFVTTAGEQPPARRVSLPLSESLQTLMVQETPSALAMFDQAHAVRNLILEQRTALADTTRDANEQMTVDVVAMLFEFILRDYQIPAEVRAQLGRLQFLVLKVALRESTLLTQKGHPARMLVNRIGAISAGLQQLDPSGARISNEICRIVETLLAGDTDSSKPFSAMLDEFDAFIATELRNGDTQIDRTVEVIENANSRTLRFTHIAAQLDGALDRLSIDPYLRTFLSSTWVYVIERAERGRAERARRFRALVPDLLWSIVPRSDADGRAQLMALLPTIVRTIREGLHCIDLTAEQQQPVLDWLVNAHRLVLRGGEASATEPSMESLHQHFAAFVDTPDDADRISLTTLPNAARQQAFLDDAVREANGDVELLDRIADQLEDAGGVLGTCGGQAVEPSEFPETSEAEGSTLDDATLARLRSGVAVELNLGGTSGIARLSWMDREQSTLVLTIAGHDAPSVISARMFRRMLTSGRLRFMETAPLFERAIAAVLKSAEDLQQAV